MNDLWERELRQRAIINAVISDYLASGMSLYRLVDDLQAAVSELRLAPEDWLEEFRTEVNELEMLRAIALDRGFINQMPDNFVTDVKSAVARMKTMMKNLPGSEHIGWE